MRGKPRILVVGFSVAAETPGFVELAAGMPQIRDRFEISKVALGGVHLHQLQYLLDQIVPASETADLVVLELATSAIRNLPAAEHYDEALANTLGYFRHLGVPLALLDLPRQDVDPHSDWLVERHRRACENLGCSYARIPLCPELLRDEVHPTPEGRMHYATQFLDLVETAGAALTNGQRAAPEADAGPIRTTSFALAGIADTGTGRRKFSRAGFSQDFVELPVGAIIEVDVPTGHQVAGLSFLIGPQTGQIILSGNGRQVPIMCYDQFAYYTRMGVRLFPPFPARSLRLEQSADLPDIALRKGARDSGPRLGAAGSLLLIRDEEKSS